MESGVHPDVYTFAAELSQGLGQGFVSRFSELADLLVHKGNVRSVATDRADFLTTNVPTDIARAVIDSSYDRARITLLNSGTVNVYLGSDRGVTATTARRYKLGPGKGITIGSRTAIYAVADPGATQGELSIIVEQWDVIPGA